MVETSVALCLFAFAHAFGFAFAHAFGFAFAYGSARLCG